MTSRELFLNSRCKLSADYVCALDTLLMIWTILSHGPGGKDEIGEVYGGEQPTCATAGATRRTATKTAFIVLP